MVCDECSEHRLALNVNNGTNKSNERVCDECAVELRKRSKHPLAISVRVANIEREWMGAAVRRSFAEATDATLPCSDELMRLSRAHGGVAAPLRARVWPVLSGSVELAAANGGMYSVFVEQCSDDMREFVRIDAVRALPDDPRFGAGGLGAPQLVRLLCAHVFRTSKRDALAVDGVKDDSEDSHRRGSYRQEMAYFAAVLLRVFGDDEETAFWCFTQLLYQFDVARYFLDGAPLLAAHLAQFERLVQLHEPQLAAHFAASLITIDLFAKRWFTTLFALDLPHSAVLRLWDDVLVFGPRWALLRMGIALLRLARADLLECGGSSELLGALQRVPSRVSNRCGELFVIVHSLT